MLIGNFDKSPVCSEAVAPLFINGHIRSFFACITRPIVINVEPLFSIRRHEVKAPIEDEIATYFKGQELKGLKCV